MEGMRGSHRRLYVDGGCMDTDQPFESEKCLPVALLPRWDSGFLYVCRVLDFPALSKKSIFITILCTLSCQMFPCYCCTANLFEGTVTNC